MRPFAFHPRHWGWLLTLMILPGLTSASGQSEAESLSISFRKAAQRILPAVVSVRAQVTLSRFESLQMPLPMPFESAPPGSGEAPTFPAPRDLGGSGLVIDAEKGLVLTNDHVVRGSKKIVVVLPDGREREVRAIHRDPKSDLALLTIEPTGLQQVHWGDSEELEIGDWVLAVGQPFGLPGTVTAGIVSGKGRSLGQALFDDDLIQTDAMISSGSSGGPLVNLKGEVVGINIAIKTSNGGYEGVGFAIPASRAARVASDLAKSGRVRRAHLGIEIRPVDPEGAERIGQPGAVAIRAVVSGSPASDAGLRSGDVIVKLNGKPVEGLGKLRSAIEFAPLDGAVELTIIRGGQTLEVRVKPEIIEEPAVAAEPPLGFVPIPHGPRLGPMPNIRGLPPRFVPPYSLPRSATSVGGQFSALGLWLSEMTPALVRRFGLDPEKPGLVVVGVENDGPADRGGLEVGMVITDAVNRHVSTVDDFRAALQARKPGQDLVVRIRKGSQAGFRVILDQADIKPEPPDQAKSAEPSTSAPAGAGAATQSPPHLDPAACPRGAKPSQPGGI
jgi:serine protease Do